MNGNDADGWDIGDDHDFDDDYHDDDGGGVSIGCDGPDGKADPDGSRDDDDDDYVDCVDYDNIYDCLYNDADWNLVDDVDYSAMIIIWTAVMIATMHVLAMKKFHLMVTVVV